MIYCCENCGWSEIVGSPIMCNYSGHRTWRDECCEAWKPKEAEAAPTVSGWVSVKDKMPRDQDIVIVAINDDSGDTPYKYSYFGWYMSEAKCWIVDDEIRRGEVYAWMPLPEPPKEEGKC